MASGKENDISKSGPTEAPKPQGLSLNHPKIESFSGISDENDRNSNLSPSKSADPSRKKMFKITSVKKGGSTGEVGTDDTDSIDGLDESQTEDLSSEFYDSSKATDLDMDLQDVMNIPLTPDEITSTTTIVVKQRPDQNSQSRFKVVKIETKEPFRRGKWVCYDFFDTAPASVVMVEKNGSKAAEDSIIQSALSDKLSLSSSIHYVQDVNDSSSNIFIPPVVSPTRNDGHHMPSDAFVPIQPAPASQVLTQLDGLSSDVMAPFIAQQVLMSVVGVPSSSSSFHNLAQPGHTTIIHNIPHNNLFPYAQNGPPVGLYQNGVSAGHASEVMSLPADGMLAVVGSGAPAMMAAVAPAVGNHSQAFPIVSSVPVSHSHSQTQLAGDAAVAPGVSSVVDPTSTSAAPVGSNVPAGGAHMHHSGRTNALSGASTNLEPGEQMGPGMSESTDSIKTLQGDVDGQTSEGLKEAVEVVGEMYMGLDGNEEDQDESGGGSTVAIDNKIEQAMDLVKRHLMYAVREEVEILKQQIGEMVERIGQLEYENTVLRSEARPETLNKLQQPRVNSAAVTAAPQPPSSSQQPAVSSQTTAASVSAAPAPQPTQAQPSSQPPLQQQQHLQQPSTSQVPPPSASSSS